MSFISKSTHGQKLNFVCRKRYPDPYAYGPPPPMRGGYPYTNQQTPMFDDFYSGFDSYGLGRAPYTHGPPLRSQPPPMNHPPSQGVITIYITIIENYSRNLSCRQSLLSRLNCNVKRRFIVEAGNVTDTI